MNIKVKEVLDCYVVYFLYAWYYPHLAMSLATEPESQQNPGLFQIPKGKF